MKNKKKIMITSVLITILAIITLAIYFNGKNQKSYIILDSNKVIEYQNGRFDYVKNENYQKSFYRVFNQNTYLGNYKIHSIDFETNDFYFSNDNSKDMFIFEEPLMGISTNIDFIEFENLEFTDSDFTKFIELSNYNNVHKKEDLYDTSKVKLDFDNDGKEEYFYTVTYEHIEDDTLEISNKNYSIMYYVDDDNNIKILSEFNPYYEGDSIIFPNYIIRSIIDVNDDKKYELVVINRMYDKPEYEIYELKNNEYEMVFATDIGGVYEK